MFTLLLIIFYSNASVALTWQFGFQQPATELMENISKSHSFIMTIIFCILGLVWALLIYVVLRFRKGKVSQVSKVTHNTALEIIWTIIPIIIVTVFTVENIKLIRMQQNIPKSELTLKVIGHQWYWHYQYPEYENLSFDSYIKEASDLDKNDLRLLAVDNHVVLPINTNIRLQVTAGDVIHSWGVPAFGIKIDAIPGRLNDTWFNIKKPGLYYGQCYELCGQGHGFMPIVVNAVSKEDFNKWINDKKSF
ncbi:cytochrome c oxidase subunit II [Wolbachia pipientis]|uniref:Cytochrome c oxidase subunit 2 n=2 Tax=Wolbachia pipientis TaxID=955 RepID=A0A1E7QJD7_WOLPI|nr:cytochrome c oxidase subunit II [Wolbachia pipientis]OEY86592.1 cytochrome c oxidase subunit II [Wolbachia pipientis]